MCTAISCGAYAGRNLDIDKSYGGEVIITPRNYKITFKEEACISSHYSMIGIGLNVDGYPLYFDAVNEKGLYIASLNYVGNAKYFTIKPNKVNLAPYELILHILAKCKDITEAKREFERINLINIPFNDTLPLAELHFFIADRCSSVTVESDENGLNIYDNPTDVLTNNPSFPIHLFNLNNYQGLSPRPVKNFLCDKLTLQEYSHGLGALGLPGDLSSSSRFIRATFHKFNSQDEDGIAKIMRLLSTVAMPDGSVKTNTGYERTEYTSAVDLDRCIYCYRTYDSLCPYAVTLSEDTLDANALITENLQRKKEPLC